MGYYEIIIADSPVNYWRLGESSGNAVDVMGVHNLAWSGTPTYGVAGAIALDSNTAMTLDGSTEYASKSVADYRSADSQGSIECWFKAPSSGGPFVIFSTADLSSLRYFFVGVSATGYIYVAQTENDTEDRVVTTTTGLNNNMWHHLCLISSGTAYSIFIDGTELSLSTLSGSNTGDWFGDTTSRDVLVIGCLQFNGGFAGHFNGSLDEVAIYDYALSASKIEEHYLAGIATATTKLIVSIQQIYGDAPKYLAVIDQPYSLRLLTALIQYYGNTPAVRRLLAQYYGSATLLRRLLAEPYGDYLKMVAAIDQEWSLPEALLMILEQRYSIAGDHLTQLMAEHYNISEFNLLRSMLEQIYILPPGEALVQTPVISVTADGVRIDPHHISIEIDEGSYYISGEIHLADQAEFLSCRHMQTVLAVTIDGTTYTLLADSPRESRPELGRAELSIYA